MKPLQDYILVKRIEESNTTPSGLVVPSRDKSRKARVEAVGPKVQGIKPGDIVFVHRAGIATDVEGQTLLLKEEEVAALYPNGTDAHQ